MSKGSIFLQFLCNLFYFYLLGRINNKLIPEDFIAHATYQTFEYSVTHSLYRYRCVCVYVYIYIGISSLNQKKWTPALNSEYSNQSRYQISV